MNCYYCKNKGTTGLANEFNEKTFECKDCNYLYYVNNDNNIIQLEFYHNNCRLAYYILADGIYRVFYYYDIRNSELIKKCYISTLKEYYKATTPIKEQKNIEKMLKTMILK